MSNSSYQGAHTLTVTSTVALSLYCYMLHVLVCLSFTVRRPLESIHDLSTGMKTMTSTVTGDDGETLASTSTFDTVGHDIHHSAQLYDVERLRLLLIWLPTPWSTLGRHQYKRLKKIPVVNA